MIGPTLYLHAQSYMYTRNLFTHNILYLYILCMCISLQKVMHLLIFTTEVHVFVGEI